MTRGTLAGPSDPASRTAPPPRGLRRPARLLAAVLMPVGPLAVALLRFLLPYDTTDSAGASVAGIAAHPDRERLVLWLLVLAFLTLVPGALAAIRLAARRAPVLATVSAVLLIPGYLALSGVGLIDNIGLAAASDQVRPGAVATVAGIVNDLPTTIALTVVFVAGHLIGTVLLALALWRARAIPVPAAVVLGISQPVHLAAALSGNHLLDLIGWGMTAAGMSFAARAVIRTSDDQWDLPPTR